MKKLSKRVRAELSATTIRDTVNSLSAQVGDLLTKLTPLMPVLQQSLPQLKSAMDKIKQMELQIASIEQAKAAAPPVAQAADDEIDDKLKGGEADNIPEDRVNKKQLDMGQKVEMEHTDDPEIAREIARDHLSEELKDGKEKKDQTYYTDLKKMHEDSCDDIVPSFWRRNLDYGADNGK